MKHRKNLTRIALIATACSLALGAAIWIPAEASTASSAAQPAAPKKFEGAVTCEILCADGHDAVGACAPGVPADVCASQFEGVCDDHGGMVLILCTTSYLHSLSQSTDTDEFGQSAVE